MSKLLLRSLRNHIPRFHSGHFHIPEPAPLVFFVNGEKHEIETPSSISTPLVDYLRGEGMKSTKIGCEEGGCGACTVISQYLDPIDRNRVITRSVNTCLTSLCSAQGKHFITLEGLADNPIMQEIQDTFVDLNATQCGFCTPGFEMTVMAFLAENSDTDTPVWDEILGGNLCRCTGYRSIIDACRNVFDSWKKDNHTLDELFPEELKDELYLESRSFFAEDTTMWLQLSNLKELFEVKDILTMGEVDNCIINGGTELMLESNLLGRELDILLYTGNIKELCGIEDTDKMLSIGSSVTLRDLEEYCEENLEKNKIFAPILHQLKLFAGRHIRNVASLGGNVVNASPTSDLNPVWLSLNAEFVIQDSSGEVRRVKSKDFFKGYRSVDLLPNEVLLTIDIPYVEDNEVVYAFKQSRRREDDIAIQNGCFRIKFDEDGTIMDSDFAFGCMSPIPIHDSSLSEYLEGKEFNKETFQNAIEYLRNDFPLIDNAPGGMVEYRRSLVISFFYKFFLKCQHEQYGLLEESDPEFSAIREEHYEDQSCEGTQFYKEFHQGTSVGQPVDHLFARPQVTGKARFVDDIPAFPNELHLGLVLSDRPTGRIDSVEVEEALSLDGVEGWVDYRDIPGENAFGVQIHDEELMVSENVQTAGQIIGAIVGKDIRVARKAARKVIVNYNEECEEPVLTIDQAIEKERYHTFFPKLGRGDVEKGFEESEFVKEGVLYCGGQEHFYIEPQASIAVPEEENHFTVHSSNQNVCGTQYDIGIIMGEPQSKIKVRTKRMGGGFGGKESRAATYAAVATVAAKKFGSPVRVVLDRHQDMQSSGQRHAFKCEYKVGYDSDGTINAIDAKLYSNAGHGTDLSAPVMERALMLFDNFYDIPNFRAKGHICLTNKPSNTAMRGFGGPQGLWAAEYIMHDVAKECGVEQKEIREKHMYDPSSEPKTPFGMDLVNCETNRIWEYLIEMSDFENRQKLVEDFNESNTRKKRGIYMVPIKFGISFAQTFLNQGHSLVHVYRDGSVLVSHGGHEMGQGLHTKVSQVAASTLGIPLEKINVIDTCTDKTANAPPTSASCGSDLNSAACQLACQEIIDNLQPLAEALGYPEKIGWDELISAAFFERISLTGYGHYKTPNLVNMDWETGKGRPFAYYTYSGGCTEVEIDSLTGDCQLLRSDIVFDCGQSINPKIDIGQVEGAFVQGLGWALTEELVFGGPGAEWFPEGQLQSKGPGFYKIPTANDVPLEMNIHLLPDSDNPFAVMSSKGLGEPPFCLGLSAFFAVREAIEAAREQAGKNSKDFTLFLPSTAERIRMACLDEFTDHIVDGEDYVAKGTY